MNIVAKPGAKEVAASAQYSPAVSIIMPFQPKMTSKASLMQALKMVVNKAELVIMERYPGEIGLMVLQKLTSMVQALNYNTHKNSIAIYVSPIFAKVLYLEIEVDQRVTVEKSCDIRDLVYSKKQSRQYLVLLLGSSESRVYLGDGASLVRIVSNTPASFYSHEYPGRKTTISTSKLVSEETNSRRFFLNVDNALGLILQAYHLPLFIAGPEKILQHFTTVSRHMQGVVDCLTGNFGQPGGQSLADVIRPYISDWKSVRQKHLVNQLEAAAMQMKLAVGITKVWQEAMRRRGTLLVVEKNFRSAAEEDAIETGIRPGESPTRHSYIRDVVDSVIEKILENGGDVEFVDPSIVAAYDHIALVR